MNKATILIEQMGAKVGLSIEDGADEMTQNMFNNLLWLCSNEQDNVTQTRIVPTDKLVSVIKAYRAVNTKQPRRGLPHQGNWKESPFNFVVVKSDVKITGRSTQVQHIYGVGEYHDFENDPWQSMSPQIAKHFDNREVLEKKSLTSLKSLMA